MRYITIPLIVVSVSLLTGCSYMMEFVVANESEQSIEVRYKVKSFPGEFEPPETPATLSVAEIGRKRGNEWHEADPSEYRLDKETRTVTVRVMPNQALRITIMHNYAGHEDTWGTENFPIEEISVVGATGELKAAGDQARRVFTGESKTLYVLRFKGAAGKQ